MTAPTSTPTPRHQLTGMTLPSGWHLDSKLPQSPGSSGGTFGTGYIASKDGQIAFVKAVDFVNAFSSADPILELTRLISESNFEKDILEYCTSRGMTRVMRFIGHEYIYVGPTTNPLNRVSCLIMEAGHDDLRRIVTKSGTTKCSWSLSVLSDVSKAINQLHKGGIAHQDVKPSNIIAVSEKSNKLAKDAISMKIGDLGRVVRKDAQGPFDTLEWPGDGRYSPPERWYRHVPTNWNDAREASDAYMLGSLMVYLFTGTTLQSLIFPQIPESFRPTHWGGSYDEDVIPVLLNVTATTLDRHLRPILPRELADDILDIAMSLTHPNPLLRGDARARKQSGRPVGIDRIQQKFDRITRRCEAIERGRSLS